MENNLESYLAEIEAQLNDVPAARRAEFMDEVRAHLHAMWEAKRADGADAATAWLHSMTEFGEPEKVGRDLRRQWADSAQLESEGAPLSKRDLARKFGWRFAAAVALGAATFLLPASLRAQLDKPSVYLLMLLVIMGFQIFRFRRINQQWTVYRIISYTFLFLLMMLPAVLMQWPASGNFLAPVSLISSLFMLWLSKREKTSRPWQWSARFKSSPVAAEQEYRFSRVFGLAIGVTMGCVSLIFMGPQILGWTFTLLSCAGFIGVAIGVGWWLQK